MAECIVTWVERLQRLKSHRDECKLVAVFQINVLRMLTTGKVREYFDLWGGGSDKTDAAKSFMDLLNKFKDFERRRKLDTAAQQNIQHGIDPTDVGAVSCWINPWSNSREYENECGGV